MVAPSAGPAFDAIVSLVDPGRRVVTVITAIRLIKETRAVCEAFKRKIEESNRGCSMLHRVGRSDFVVIAHFDDLGRYEAWIDTYILSDDSVQRSETHLVYCGIKYDTAVPV